MAPLTATAHIRNPLATRPQPHSTGMSISPSRTSLRKGSSTKRPLSPEPAAEISSHGSKRVKTASTARVVQESPTPAAASRAELKKEKDKRRGEKLLRDEEFKIKYTRAFPNWVFYFDLDTGNPEVAATRNHLEKRISYMGARVEDFFSNKITHLITLHEVDEKENNEKDLVKGASTSAQSGLLGSPIRLRGRTLNSTSADSLVHQARRFEIKIWSAVKLHNVLDRCEAPRVSAATGSLPAHAQKASREHNLARLLETERLHGTTERDPTQRRHDYVYFSKDSYFVLVEDLKQELATVAAVEYPITKGKNGKETGSWPVLHCHPLARGPFLTYDEKEERRRQKSEKAEKDRQAEKTRRKARLVQHERKRKAQQVRIQAAREHDLRRCASMNNLRRRATLPDANIGPFVDLDADFPEDSQMESVNASGYLASGAYMAASGNSVSITSTTGTTSAGGLLRNLHLPAGLKGMLQQEVTMSRRAPSQGTINRDNKENIMGPPPMIPERTKFLRKSRSTNTLKLPKRDEVSKPGYCESCRVKFENFRDHIVSKKHRKFAMDDNNFQALDAILARVKRRTTEEVAEANARFLEAKAEANMNLEEDDSALPQLGDQGFSFGLGEDVRWDEWVEVENAVDANV